jgi:hypothetical protein
MAVLQLRRQATASPPPPTSAARQMLAERVAADRAATQRQAELGTILERARTEMWAARDAVAAAEGVVARAAADAAEYATARLLGTAGAPPLTPAEARAALQAAKDSDAAATAARNTIEAELERLVADARNRQYWLAEAAAAVMAEECSGAVQSLLGEIDALSRSLVDKGIALQWLISSHVIREMGPTAFPGALEMNCRSTSPATMWSLWGRPDASPTEARWAAALAALKADPSAPVPVVSV